MSYLEFYERWHALGCFSVHQVRAWRPDFNRHNLYQWRQKGLLVGLRKECYAFADSLRQPDFVRYVANRIYRPSYISLHYALSYYGMIPEEVVQITSVTTLKTASFASAAGHYSYQSVRPAMLFGYVARPMADGRSVLIATPEKSLLDLLYLYPFYRSADDMLQLRLDEDFMHDELDTARLLGYVEQTGSHTLAKRVATLLNAYELS